MGTSGTWLVGDKMNCDTDFHSYHRVLQRTKRARKKGEQDAQL